jgi:hypothetical protein
MAEEYIAEAIKNWKEKMPGDHHYFGKGYYWLGKVMNENSKPAAAELYLKKSLQIRKRILPEDNSALILTECELGKSLILQKRFNEAEIILVRNFEKAEINKSFTDEEKKYIREIIVSLYRNWGKKDGLKTYSD